MYASANLFTRAPRVGLHALAGAYQQIGTETAVAMADPHELVQLLFNGLFESLQKARVAMLAGDVVTKGQAIGRAVRIVDEGLKAGLNLQMGGELAANLQALYMYVSSRLTYANLKNDPAALEECRLLLLPVREAWSAIAPKSSRN